MILALVGIPLVFTMAVWVVVTSIRILNPEKELPVVRAAERLHRRRLLSGAPRRLRREDIRELERERYQLGLEAAGKPGQDLKAWYRELDERRN